MTKANLKRPQREAQTNSVRVYPVGADLLTV